MYKAMEIPSDKQCGHEHLYISDSVRRRFEGLTWELKCVGLTLKDTARLSGINYESLRHYSSMKGYPMMFTYLKLAAFMGWDLSRDVNWHYAQVLHKPDEIRYRLHRIFPNCTNCKEYAQQLSKNLQYHAKPIEMTLGYGRSRSSYLYGVIMHWIMDREKRRRLDDPLDLEK